MREFWVVALLVGSGCAGDLGAPPRSVELARVLQSEGRLVSIGVEDDSLLSFSRIVSAGITPDGRFIAVLTGHAPFVRVFDRDGQLQAAFLGMGDGPGESRGPYSMAVSRSRLLVLDRAVKIFQFNGTPTNEYSVAGGMWISALPGCTEDWIIYGPAASEPGSSGTTWVQRLDPTAMDGQAWQALFSSLGRSTRIGFGAGQSLGHSANEFLIFHRYGDPSVFIRGNCRDAAWGIEPDLAFLVKQRETGRPPTVGLGQHMLGGLALVQDGVLWLEGVIGLPPGSASPDEAMIETRMTLVTQDSVFDAAVPGWYSVRDSRLGSELLLSVEDPYPQVLLLDEAVVIDAIRRGRARRR